MVAVQYPGRLDRVREAPIRSVEEAAGRVATEFGARRGRLVVFGTSMGALIAFETACRLEALDVPVDLLVVAGSPPPGLAARSALRSERDDAGIVAEMIMLGGASSEVSDYPELLALLLPVLRAEYRAVESYRPAAGVQVSCTVLGVVGDADPLMTADDAAGWCAATTADFRVETLVGGHLLAESAPQLLADAVQRELRAR